MAEQVYAQFFVFVDQKLLEEEVDVDWDVDFDTKIVTTQAKAFAGASKGSGKFTVNVNNACPRTGPELNYFTMGENIQFVDCIITVGTVQLISKGVIMNIKGKGGASNPTDVSFTFVGGLPKIK
jgi:hypothetical protein